MFSSVRFLFVCFRCIFSLLLLLFVSMRPPSQHANKCMVPQLHPSLSNPPPPSTDVTLPASNLKTNDTLLWFQIYIQSMKIANLYCFHALSPFFFSLLGAFCSPCMYIDLRFFVCLFDSDDSGGVGPI